MIEHRAGRTDVQTMDLEDAVVAGHENPSPDRPNAWRKLLLFTTYSTYICASVAVASLLPAVEEDQNWTADTMVAIGSSQALGAYDAKLLP